MLKELDVQECDAIGLNQWMKAGLIKIFDRGSKF
jgi:hypothetical protein